MVALSKSYDFKNPVFDYIQIYLRQVSTSTSHGSFIHQADMLKLRSCACLYVSKEGTKYGYFKGVYHYNMELFDNESSQISNTGFIIWNSDIVLHCWKMIPYLFPRVGILQAKFKLNSNRRIYPNKQLLAN